MSASRLPTPTAVVVVAAVAGAVLRRAAPPRDPPQSPAGTRDLRGPALDVLAHPLTSAVLRAPCTHRGPEAYRRNRAHRRPGCAAVPSPGQASDPGLSI